jgi:Zn-dependent protease
MEIIGIIIFIFTIVIHEVAHGWMADRLGDPTARLSGRITLNPLAHIDLYGSVLLPLFLILVRSPFLFGWAKPVPIDPYNLKNPRKDSALIALAGPLSNITVATFLAILHLFAESSLVGGILRMAIALNVTLALFNLIPVHPLDGGKILTGILLPKQANEFDIFMNRYGLIILAMTIFPVFGSLSLISYFLYPLINIVLHLLVPGFSRI